jgi:hypothetical protein
MTAIAPVSGARQVQLPLAQGGLSRANLTDAHTGCLVSGMAGHLPRR